jgi:hypothetical protein
MLFKWSLLLSGHLHLSGRWQDLPTQTTNVTMMRLVYVLKIHANTILGAIVNFIKTRIAHGIT